ncbi:MAG TPA: hypothetical protein DDY32_08135 [Desulfobulbaceae bacterium]|nr:hypothetical protein [Desulfobulbaceae bacterium]
MAEAGVNYVGSLQINAQNAQLYVQKLHSTGRFAAKAEGMMDGGGGGNDTMPGQSDVQLVPGRLATSKAEIDGTEKPGSVSGRVGK